MAPPRRLTQKEIARLAGVSQATVSLVLNSATNGDARIPEETRERVEKVIRDTGYVADPVARRMAKGLNRILGVFTYEPAFPSDQADFFAPFMLGIEEAAQQLGYDLLLFTATPDGRRRIFDEHTRLRLADGCLIIGRSFDRDELARLVAGDYPFVAIGRRDDAGGPVPYVGADYARAAAHMVERAVALGHRRFAYIGNPDRAESMRDRFQGFRDGVAAHGAELALHVPEARRPADEILDAIAAAGVTVAFFLELADAVEVEAAARRRRLSVPGDLSLVVTGSHERARRPAGADFTSFGIPREEMGRQATAMLAGMLEGRSGPGQVLVPCDIVAGATLGPIGPAATRPAPSKTRHKKEDVT